MRLSLEHLDAHGLNIDLPPSPSGEPRRIQIASGAGLSGVLVQEGELLEIDSLRADTLVLGGLSLVFGSLGLSENSETVFHGVRGWLRRRGGVLNLELEAERASARLLVIESGNVLLRGEVHLENLSLEQKEGRGALRAGRLVVKGFCSRLSQVQVASHALTGSDVAIGWGGPGFRLQAGTVHMDTCETSTGTLHVAGEELHLRNLSWHAGDLALGSASTAKARLDATLALTESSAAEVPEERKNGRSRSVHAERSFPWELLDGLAGELNADLHVDLAVPVVGSRRATHRFRLPVRSGTIDYMELEGGLSRLENSLLDFAVRGERLVLERGIPLLPTRGRGKPLLRWELGERDLELARQHRVRLAVLPKAEKPSSAELATDATEGNAEETTQEAGNDSRVALRRLGVDNLDVQLQLEPRDDGVAGLLRALAFEDLRVAGALEYAPEGATREGEITASARGLSTSLREVTLGGKRLALEHLALGSLTRARTRLWGLQPRELSLELSALACEGIRLGSSAEGHLASAQAGPGQSPRERTGTQER